MEGCGIAAGDEFLKTELTAIMNSPAWRTQRSVPSPPMTVTPSR
jgi:hypothetical protein